MVIKREGSIKKHYQLMLELIIRRRAGHFDSQYFIPSLLELIEWINPLDKKELMRLCHWVDYGYLNLEFYAQSKTAKQYWKNQIEASFDVLMIRIKSRILAYTLK